MTEESGPGRRDQHRAHLFGKIISDTYMRFDVIAWMIEQGTIEPRNLRGFAQSMRETAVGVERMADGVEVDMKFGGESGTPEEDIALMPIFAGTLVDLAELGEIAAEAVENDVIPWDMVGTIAERLESAGRKFRKLEKRGPIPGRGDGVDK